MSKYPPDWKQISLRIKERASWRCECEGMCGVDHKGRCERHHGDTFEPSGVSRKWPVILTTAHHPDPTYSNIADDNLHALCQGCHLRLDLEHHKAKASATRARKAAMGTAPLFGEPA